MFLRNDPFHDLEALSCIAIRIGAYLPREVVQSREYAHDLDLWVSPRDLVQLFERCIKDTSLQFAVFHGISDNTFKRLDISDARQLLGYAPKDDGFDENANIADWKLPENPPETTPINPEKSGLRKEL